MNDMDQQFARAVAFVFVAIGLAISGCGPSQADLETRYETASKILDRETAALNRAKADLHSKRDEYDQYIKVTSDLVKQLSTKPKHAAEKAQYEVDLAELIARKKEIELPLEQVFTKCQKRYKDALTSRNEAEAALNAAR